MKHLLEAIVQVANAELSIPVIAELGQVQAGGTHQMRTSRNAARALQDIVNLELESLPDSVAKINPLDRNKLDPITQRLIKAVNEAAAANFGGELTQIRMGWFCTNEDSQQVRNYEVTTGSPTADGQDMGDDDDRNGYQAYCGFHSRYEVVELRELPEDAPEEEAEIFIPGPDARFRIRRAPEPWVVQRLMSDYAIDATGYIGETGRVLWDERYLNPENNERVRGWFVRMDNGNEHWLPGDIMGAAQ